MLIVSWISRCIPGLIQTCFLFGLLQTVSVIKQNYCIYTQWFESGLQAPKAIKFGHMAQVKKNPPELSTGAPASFCGLADSL
jgi:hypothetical protein